MSIERGTAKARPLHVSLPPQLLIQMDEGLHVLKTLDDAVAALGEPFRDNLSELLDWEADQLVIVKYDTWADPPGVLGQETSNIDPGQSHTEFYVAETPHPQGPNRMVGVEIFALEQGAPVSLGPVRRSEVPPESDLEDLEEFLN